MLRSFSMLSGALLIILASPLNAQLGPQAFLPPPPLTETQKPGALHIQAMAAVLSTPSGTVCNPAAEVSHNGSIPFWKHFR